MQWCPIPTYITASTWSSTRVSGVRVEFGHSIEIVSGRFAVLLCAQSGKIVNTTDLDPGAGAVAALSVGMTSHAPP